MNPLATLSSAASMQLPHRALVHVPDAAAVQLECRSGSLWITVDNDTRDTVLNAGECFTSTEHRHALIYALECASLTIRPVVAAQPVSRAHAWPVRPALSFM